MHTSNLSTQEAEEGGLLQVQGQSCPHRELQVIQGYKVRLREVAQYLRALFTLTKDPGSIPSPHMTSPTPAPEL